jgi:hypothetical protein
MGGIFGKILGGLGGGALGFLTGGPLGAIAGGLSGLSGGGGGGGGRAASGYMNQIPQVNAQYLNPFLQEYGPAQNQSGDIYNSMLNQYSSDSPVSGAYHYQGLDPINWTRQVMQSYEPSAGYKYKQDRMGSAMRNTAASGGFLGTKMDQEAQADLVRSLLGQDMQEYLTNIANAKAAGLGGAERMMEGRNRAFEMGNTNAQNRAQRAYTAADTMATGHTTALGNQANLAYNQGQNRAANNASMFGGLSNMISNAKPGSIFGNLFGSSGQIQNSGSKGHGGWF